MHLLHVSSPTPRLLPLARLKFLSARLMITVTSSLYKGSPQQFLLKQTTEYDLNESVVVSFLDSTSDDCLGLAPVYGQNCQLISLAFSSPAQVLYVKFAKLCSQKKRARSRALLRRLLEHCETKFAFQMDNVALALWRDHNLCITNAVDLLSLCSEHDRSTRGILKAMGGPDTINEQDVVHLFSHDEADQVDIQDCALQAWAAVMVGNRCVELRKGKSLINTVTFPKAVCLLLSPRPFAASYSLSYASTSRHWLASIMRTDV
jgi:hypothetical protein